MALPAPLAFDVVAEATCAMSGALVGLRKRYDFFGVFALALATGAGGGVIRDLLLGAPVALVAGSRDIVCIVLAATATIALARRRPGARPLPPALETLMDTLGMAFYAAVGCGRAREAGLAAAPIVLVGVVNAIGGGVVRDVLAREEPVVFKPSGFYAAAALAGAGTYVGTASWQPPLVAAAACAVVAVVARAGSLRFGWRTREAAPPPEAPQARRAA